MDNNNNSKKESSPAPQFENINSLALSLMVQLNLVEFGINETHMLLVESRK